jgi:uncharacterized membrane protein (DUF4010 family)
MIYVVSETRPIATGALTYAIFAARSTLFHKTKPATMLEFDLAMRFAAAIGLGLLLGMERQRKSDQEMMFGGVRTFALIALLGAAGAFAQQELDLNWVAPLTFVAVGSLIVVAYAVSAEKGELGITTEISALLSFVLGGFCGWGQIGIASALAIAGLLLLTLKNYLHDLAQRVEAADVEATVKFAVISVIILPLLPNENFGPPPIDVINPYKIWLMVVLIAGLNFFGYVLVKVLGNEHGVGVTGILGGLVSSTAVTLTFSERSREEPQQSQAFALAIILAWTIMFVRVPVLVAVVQWRLGLILAASLSFMAAAGVIAAFVLWRRSRSHKKGKGAVAAGGNPLELSKAIRFGLLFGVITVVAKAAEAYLGTGGLYLAGALAGLTDVDAISLSMANLAASNVDGTIVAARTIVIAVVANTLTKAGMALSIGAPEMRRIVVPTTLAFLIAAAIGIIVAAQLNP